MDDSDPERRASGRVNPVGTAIVMRAGSAERAEFAIRDLSAKGMRLVGNARLVEGERVRVTFSVEGAEVAIDAVVARTEPQRAQVALELQNVPPAAAATIARAIAAMRQRATSASSVLVCHPDAETRAALERDILRLGRKATLFASVDEARAALDAAGAAFSAVLIAAGLPGDAVRALVDHLTARHPHVRRVMLFGERLESIDHAISSRIDAIVRMPSRIRPLARALGIDSNDSSLALLMPDPSGKPR